MSERRVTNTRRDVEQNRVDARAKRPESQDVHSQLGEVLPVVLVPGRRRHLGLLLRARRNPITTSHRQSRRPRSRSRARSPTPRPGHSHRPRKVDTVMPLARPLATAFSRRARRHAMNTKRAHRSRARTTPPRARRARDTRATTQESIVAEVASAARGSIGNPRPRSRARRVRRAANARRTRARIYVRSFAPPRRPSFQKSRTSRRRTGVDRGGEREAGSTRKGRARGCDSMVTYLPADTSNQKSAAQLRRASSRAC